MRSEVAMARDPVDDLFPLSMLYFCMNLFYGVALPSVIACCICRWHWPDAVWFSWAVVPPTLLLVFSGGLVIIGSLLHLPRLVADADKKGERR